MSDDERNFIIIRKHLLMDIWFIVKEIKGVKKLKKYLGTNKSLTSTKVIEGNFVETELKFTIIENKEETTTDIQ